MVLFLTYYLALKSAEFFKYLPGGNSGLQHLSSNRLSTTLVLRVLWGNLFPLTRYVLYFSYLFSFLFCEEKLKRFCFYSEMVPCFLLPVLAGLGVSF